MHIYLTPEVYAREIHHTHLVLPAILHWKCLD